MGIYGGDQWGALSLRSGASYSWNDIKTQRNVTVPSIGGNLRGDYDAGTAQIFGELGYRMDVERIAFEPYAGLAYVNLHTGGFAEQGGIAGLNASSQDTNVGFSTLGLRASTDFPLQGMDKMTLRGGLGWRHAFDDVDPTVTMAFAGSNGFTVSGVPIARDAALVEAGFDIAVSKNATVGAFYNGQLAQHTQDHSFKGVLAVKF